MTRSPGPWLRALAGVAILAALGWRLGTDAFLAGMRVIDPGSGAAALGIGLATTVCSAGRWCLVARGLGMRLSLPGAVAGYYRSLFLNTVLPTGVLGDAHRAVSHGRQVGDVGRGVRAVILERAAGQVVLVAVALAVLAVRPALVASVADSLTWGAGPTTAGLAALAVLAAVALWARRGAPGSRRRRTLAVVGTDARDGLLSRGTWPGVVLLSTGALAGHVALFLVAARSAGSAVPVGQLVPLVVLVLVVMVLPVSMGGWGPREAAAVVAFGAAGLGAAHGLTVAVAYGVLTIVANLPGGAVLALGRGTRTARSGFGAGGNRVSA